MRLFKKNQCFLCLLAFITFFQSSIGYVCLVVISVLLHSILGYYFLITISLIALSLLYNAVIMSIYFYDYANVLGYLKSASKFRIMLQLEFIQVTVQIGC